ncbi:hypothetical protein ACTFIW_012405 [Dictyostelium discoideum]|uniref:Centrin-A n=1 Tax=Dictyostelium discoideum TaxID=44689 RepID=CETNA_DICDI|nr:hypothetical protein DDB_G0288427 [Dictyostelium discoideum AX4]Q54IY3.1 RecName: Full=Centrin-A; AltName: Full=Ddcrp [Dictyostelium discoideum]EAL63239.1 hypothetical protein DDB_G0288427 [Dictyostelium discoideum AX4]|eukprot:XP_636747.1 hypothetical protein DDB_G0288427 [Dictyostelium discoideum AX4]
MKTKTCKNLISNEQIQEVQEVYDTFKCRNGEMDKINIQYGFRALGVRLGEEEVEKIFKNQQYINFNSFLDIVTPLIYKIDVYASFEQAFSLFDRDGSGYITFDDLKTVAINLGEARSDSKLYNMIKRADLNGDKKISKIEFIQLLYWKKIY